MPYKYAFEHGYETVEDIEREWNDVRKHPVSTRYGVNKVKEARLAAARHREKYLKNLELRDQAAPKIMTMTVDLMNPYDIERTIRMLQIALEEAKNQVILVPDPPPCHYI